VLTAGNDMRIENHIPSQNIRHQGFSAIELMAVLAVALILMAIGVPAMHALIQNQRLTSTVNDFFASVNLARSEAIQRRVRVDIVPKDAAGDWAKGWVVLINTNNNQQADAGQRVIFTHDPVPKGMSIGANLTDSKVQYLAYNGSGRSRTNASDQQTQFGTFTFRLDGYTRKIKLNFLGRPRVCNPDTDRSTC
jgi:type IV fimbrial biogenesis protein FimT